MLEEIVPQVSQEVKDVLERINAISERNRKEYEALARMTGRTLAEVEADLTAPDPGLEDDQDAERYALGECALDGAWWGYSVEEVMA